MKLLVLVATLLAAAGLGAAYAAGSFGSGSHTRVVGTAPPPPDARELASIRMLVLRAAADLGDPNPTDGVLVPTTRRLAELVDVDTAAPDIPVYFVLVHGEFTGGTLLTLTIDPATNKSLGTGLVGAMPDMDAMGTPQPLPLAGGPPSLGTALELTKNVPCLRSGERRVGPRILRRFHAVTAVSCIEGRRVYPGHGEWAVIKRRVAVSSVAGLQRYFEQPDKPDLPKNGVCLTNLVWILMPTFVDAQSHWLVPRTPVDGCGHPLGYSYGRGPPTVRWHVVSVRKIKQVSAG